MSTVKISTTTPLAHTIKSHLIKELKEKKFSTNMVYEMPKRKQG